MIDRYKTFSIALTLSTDVINLENWEGEYWNWDTDAGLALYPINFSDRTVKVLRRFGEIVGIPKGELWDSTMQIFIPDDEAEPVILCFLQAMNGSFLCVIRMPAISASDRQAIRSLHMGNNTPILSGTPPVVHHIALSLLAHWGVDW